MRKSLLGGRSAVLFCAALGASIVAAQPAFAASPATANLAISATITPTCQVSTKPVKFGNIDVTSSSTFDATGTVTVTCTSGTDWTLTGSAGQDANATYLDRVMGDGNGNRLHYALFTDSARQVAWVDQVGLLGAFFGTGTGSAQDNTVYGRIPSGQKTLPAGSYADTVLVTVSY